MATQTRGNRKARVLGLRIGKRGIYAALFLAALIPTIVFVVAGADAERVSLKGAGGPAVAFSAGLLSFLSPCVLPLVPIYITNLAGASFGRDGSVSTSRATTLPHAAAFLGGLSAVFIALGASVGLVGYVLVDHQRTLEQVAGILMVGMAILIVPELGRRSPIRSALLLVAITAVTVATIELASLEGDRTRLLLLFTAMALTWAKFAGYLPVVGLLQRTFQIDTGARKSVSYGRSATIGGAFALGWTPCIGPILGSIYLLAASSGDAWTGAYLLGFYSLGFSVPFLITALALDDVTRAIKRVRRFMPVFEVASALMLIAIGILLITGRLTQLNAYFDIGNFDEGL